MFHLINEHGFKTIQPSSDAINFNDVETRGTGCAVSHFSSMIIQRFIVEEEQEFPLDALM